MPKGAEIEPQTPSLQTPSLQTPSQIQATNATSEQHAVGPNTVRPPALNLRRSLRNSGNFSFFPQSSSTDAHSSASSYRRKTLEEQFADIAVTPMAARNNRGRAGPSREDPAAAQEETSMWNQIVADLRLCKELKDKYSETIDQVVELEKTMAVEKANRKGPSVAKIDELAALYREIRRLSEEERKILHEEPHDVIKNLGILRALRAASVTEPRNAQQSKPRTQKNKPKDMDGLAESPGPSTNVATTAAKAKGSSVRSGSVPSTLGVKETSVKLEEGAEGTKGPSAEKAGKFYIGAVVAYKQAKMKDDGSQWIQCNIIAISEFGNKKRYEVQDPEPDESGAPGQIYKTSAASMIAVPTQDTVLAELQVGKHVLARYPETTTFYRAEVTAIKKDTYWLKFEDDQNQEMEVGRRFVLDLGGK